MTDREREGVGGVGRLGRPCEPEHPGDHRRDLRLVGAAAAADRCLDLGRGVQRDRRPRRSASIMAMPVTCAVPITVETLVSAKTRSIATDSGRCRSNQSRISSSTATSRFGGRVTGGRADDPDLDEVSSGRGRRRRHRHHSG